MVPLICITHMAFCCTIAHFVNIDRFVQNELSPSIERDILGQPYRSGRRAVKYVCMHIILFGLGIQKVATDGNTVKIYLCLF